MAKGSKKVLSASMASKALQSKGTSKLTKSLAASVLAQAKGKKRFLTASYMNVKYFYT
ncbi:hypothetical protein ACQVPY_15200 [Bacillus pretiosus]|uniref:hypothetical protein n=1 Tax=Bacillus pretiosus TaxID=2983392 RepID=UPI003D654D54